MVTDNSCTEGCTDMDFAAEAAAAQKRLAETINRSAGQHGLHFRRSVLLAAVERGVVREFAEVRAKGMQ